MIDPTNISNFNLNDSELEENILFWVCAAGKNGVTSAKALNRFLTGIRFFHDYPSPFASIKRCEKDFGQLFIENSMRQAGIGCMKMKAKTFVSLAYSKIDLRRCTVDQLMQFKGIGPKTARAFILHTRPNQRLAVIDTHILKFLRHYGIPNVPSSTPPKGPTYRRMEDAFLVICDSYGISPVKLDLDVWNHYRVKPNEVYTIK